MSAVEPIEMDEDTGEYQSLMECRQRELDEAWSRIEAREKAIVRLAPKYGAHIVADIEYDLALVRGALGYREERWNG